MNHFNALFHKMDKPIVGVVSPPRNNGRLIVDVIQLLI